jgi:hypothetical protein
MIPKSITCVFTFHHNGYKAMLLETRISTDWREIPAWTIEIRRPNGTTVAVLEQPFGIGRQAAVENIPALMGHWQLADRTGMLNGPQLEAA